MSGNEIKHELIRASAGTGKTYQLTSRYLRLLQLGERPDEILAATFTRKAAGEILNRVLLRLAEAATDADQLAELQSALGDDSLTHDDCCELLVSATSSLHRLRIGTLDSFFAQLAGSFSLELGLPPGWQIAEEYEDSVLRAQAVDALLDSESKADLLTLVHALTRGETTRSLEREVRDKVNSLYSIYRESPRKAWHRVPRSQELADGQLREAVAALRAVPLPEHKLWRANHDKAVEAAEAGDWSSFVSGGVAGKVAAGQTSYYRKPIEPAVEAAYRTLINHATAVQLNQLANQTEATYRLLDKFHAHYERLKSEYRAIRFDDVTFRLAEAVNTVRAKDCGFRLDAHLRHLLLDEFQDTSLPQWSVVRPFAQPITREAPQPPLAKAGLKCIGPSFFCVGDVKQAIYGWRGGVAEIFDAVTRELDGIRQRPLDTSWRSSPVIVDTVNQIFQRLDRHSHLGDLAEAVTRWQSQFNEHATAEPKKRLNGFACLQAARTPTPDELGTQKDITLRFAAEQVAKWKRKAPGFEIGVLVRRNDAVRRLIYELRELGIEASEEGGSSLDDSAAVRLVLSLMQLADHPGDRVARFHLATSPLANSLELDSADDDQAAGRLAGQIRRKLMTDGYGPTVYGLARRLAPECNRRELRRLEKLIGLAYQYEPAATSRPSAFVSFVQAQKVRDPVAADVRVMTVHQAKGLEFDIVVLADLEADLIGQRGDLVVGRPSPTAPIDRVCRRAGKEVRQLMPESWQRLFHEADDQDVVESLCVLYVAATRSIHALHMIVTPSADNERSLHKTFGGLLRAALTDGGKVAAEQIAYQNGDPQWFENPGVTHTPTEAEVASQEQTLEPLDIQLAKPAERRWRGLQRVSPSSLEGGSLKRLSDAVSDSNTERSAALQRGTLIHAWFEQIEWLSDGAPSDDRLRQVANEVLDVPLSDDDLRRFLGEFREMLAHPKIAACLNREAYSRYAAATLTVENERPIAIRLEDELLAGNIDRLVTIYRDGTPIAADILDFKTDRIDDDGESAIAKKIDFYRPQIDAYRRAVEKIIGIPAKRIRARLLFVNGGIVEEL